MARSSIRNELQRRIREHLAIAETHPPERAPLDVRHVATALKVSPTTLYKYGFNSEIYAAEQRQRERTLTCGPAIEEQYFKNEIRRQAEELDKERQRNKALVARIAIIEANTARLGFDPEELLKPILKPLRNASRAGFSKPRQSTRF
jgi:hypothetical protein